MRQHTWPIRLILIKLCLMDVCTTKSNSLIEIVDSYINSCFRCAIVYRRRQQVRLQPRFKSLINLFIKKPERKRQKFNTFYPEVEQLVYIDKSEMEKSAIETDLNRNMKHATLTSVKDCYLFLKYTNLTAIFWTCFLHCFPTMWNQRDSFNYWKFWKHWWRKLAFSFLKVRLNSYIWMEIDLMNTNDLLPCSLLY